MRCVCSANRVVKFKIIEWQIAYDGLTGGAVRAEHHSFEWHNSCKLTARDAAKCVISEIFQKERSALVAATERNEYAGVDCSCKIIAYAVEWNFYLLLIYLLLIDLNNLS